LPLVPISEGENPGQGKQRQKRPNRQN
jgi:hypothetical protein